MSLHEFFLTKRSLYALVADTRKEDTDFYYWLNVVELLSNNSPLLIVKNEKGDRLLKKSRYIPKRLLARVEKMEGAKVAVREILELLGGKYLISGIGDFAEKC